MIFALWILFLLLNGFELGFSQRICELQGTCYRCEHNRYSFYTCHSSEDCFPEEFCNPQRFCCPINVLPQKITAKNEPVSTSSSNFGSYPDGLLLSRNSLPRCPDDSEWLRMCKIDSDCIFRDEICAEGKCCPSCKQRRTQVLAEIPHDIKDSQGLWVTSSFIIPQCDSFDTRLYAPMQCRRDSAVCYCVTSYGRHLTDEINLKEIDLNCTYVREVMLKKKPIIEHVTLRDSIITLPKFNLTNVIERSFEQHDDDVLEIGRNGMRNASSTKTSPTTLKYQQNFSSIADFSRKEKQSPKRDAVEVCSDPLREFNTCGSSCPISCATRNSPKCPPEECQRGCFCRLPYVILDGAKPFSSKCVLPAECPLLAFTQDLNSWHGGLFPDVSAQSPPPINPVYNVAPKVVALSDAGFGGAVLDKCSDPLKNFQTCGTACPAACNSQRQLTAEDCANSASQCVAGCFCRAPYILKNPNDINSICVLPQHCQMSSTSTTTVTTLDLGQNKNSENSCSLPNQIWTRCFSKKCSRSCELPAAEALLCVPDDCQPGCACKAPFVQLNSIDSDHCILPEQCPVSWFRSHNNNNNNNSITTPELIKLFGGENFDPETIPPAGYAQQQNDHNLNSESFKCSIETTNKEWRNCASSCPLGCDNLELQLCTPCVAGCFCKNGYVFKNSSDWRHSECVVISKCSTISSSTLSNKNFEAIENIDSSIQPINTNTFCPKNVTDRNGRTCETDFECGFQQKCCSYSNSKSSGNARKCTCLDANAIWMECGTVCPNYCGADSATLRENCPKICRPGWMYFSFCVSGFIKQTRDSNSICVPISECRNSSNYESISINTRKSNPLSRIIESIKSATDSTKEQEHNDESELFFSTTKAINDEDSCGEAIASAVLYARDGVRLGRLLVRPDRRYNSNKNRHIRITGDLELFGSSTASSSLYYLALHQFSDTTIGGCRNVGKPLLLTTIEEGDSNGFSVTSTSTNLELKSQSGGIVPVDRVILWPDSISQGTNPLIGHSLVLKTFSSKRDALLSERNEEMARNGMIACAVLGIVPSC